MTEWLTQMPPTVPFHKGQVLIVPESPYGQRVATPRAQTARTVRHGPKCGDWKQHFREMHAGVRRPQTPDPKPSTCVWRPQTLNPRPWNSRR